MNESKLKNIEIKKQVLTQFIEAIQREKSALIQSAKAAHLAATHEESRAEDKHDTFAIEASYLAAGQATRVQDLEQTEIHLQNALETLRVYPTIEPVCLFQMRAEKASKAQVYLLALHGGGTQLHTKGSELGALSVQILTPSSPLGEQVLGLAAGDTVELESAQGIRELTIDWIV